MLSVLLAWIAFVSSTSALPYKSSSADALIRRGGQNPDNDPFYTPAAGFQNNSLGTVLRSRTFNVTLDGKPLNATGTQLLYLTQGANETTFASVTTVFQPNNSRPDALIAYQVHEDADTTRCAFSYEYYTGLNSTDTENFFIESFLIQGYTVVVADYEGPDSPFSAGFVAAHGVLDSIRATLSYKPFGLSNSTKIVGLGYSGGGHSTGWSSVVQPSYAPELNIAGWSMGGVPSDIEAVFYYLDGGLYGYFSWIGAFGLAQAYSDFLSYLESTLTDQGRTMVDEVYNSCLTNIPNFAYKPLLGTQYQTAGAGLLNATVAQNALKANHLGVNASLVPTAPVLMTHTATDEIAPFSSSVELYNNFCAHGAPSVEYIVNNNTAGHQSTEFYFFDDVMRFVNSRMDNSTAPVAGCNRTNASLPLLDPASAPSGLTQIYQAINTLITKDLGESGDSIINAMLAQQAKALNSSMSASASAGPSAAASASAKR